MANKSTVKTKNRNSVNPLASDAIGLNNQNNGENLIKQSPANEVVEVVDEKKKNNEENALYDFGTFIHKNPSTFNTLVAIVPLLVWASNLQGGHFKLLLMFFLCLVFMLLLRDIWIKLSLVGRVSWALQALKTSIVLIINLAIIQAGIKVYNTDRLGAYASMILLFFQIVTVFDEYYYYLRRNNRKLYLGIIGSIAIGLYFLMDKLFFYFSNDLSLWITTNIYIIIGFSGYFFIRLLADFLQPPNKSGGDGINV